MSASATASSSEEEWSISVKTVGAERQQEEDNGGEIPSSFQVRVRPGDDIATLHDGIETITGLKHNQQRLIYRGRIIQGPVNKKKKKAEGSADENNKETNSENGGGSTSTGEGSKISDVKGLSDGQTIHLVKRPASSISDGDSDEQPNDGSEINNTESGSANNNNNNGTTDSPTSGSASGTSLLAALLGLSGLEDDADETGEGAATTSTPTASRLGGSGYRRYGNRRSRNHYRLTAEDLEVPDPGSMETVRQGLMTLHTLLPNAQATMEQQRVEQEEQNPSNRPPNPLEQHRNWYIGQWIDCRDTVNQWLEATIIDIVRPDEILPEAARSNNNNNNTPESRIIPAMDAAVGSTDFDGRQRLLLETCTEGDEDDLGGELAGYRLRDNNQHVVLLHIHYNGWPHRWDEWIRSDSERIRPFRVRTRHAVAGTLVSPNIQSPYADAPETYIGGRNDVQDRAFVLQELVRVSSQVNELAVRAAAALEPVTASVVNNNNSTAASQNSESSSVGTSVDRGNLPWNTVSPTPRSEVEPDDNVPPLADDNIIETSENDDPSETAGDATPTARNSSNDESNNNTAVTNYDLERLAPLIDRLGRTMVDAAPHIASLAASAPLPNNRVRVNTRPAEQESPSNSAADATSESAGNNNNNNNNNNTNNPNSLGGLLSLLNRERRRNSRTSGSQITDQALTHVSDTGGIDPDYMDFSTGVVNTSRGDVRTGPRGRSGRDDLSGLLGAYLAAASLGGLGSGGSGGDSGTGSGDDNGNDMQGLGRLLQARGNGDNGGIDIHIHAVVTAPGMGPGMIAGTGGGGGGGGTGGPSPVALGLGGGTGAGPTAAPSDLFANTRRASAQRVRATLLEQNEEDNGIFDDLYSENPDPVDSTSSGEDGGGAGGNNGSGNNNEGSARRSMRNNTSSLIPESTPINNNTNSNNNNRRGSRRSSQRNSSSGGSQRSSSLLGRLFRRNDRTPES